MLLWTLLATALAFEVLDNELGAEVQWPAMPVWYEIDSTSAPDDLPRLDQEEAVRGSMEAWNAVIGSDVLLEEGSPQADPSQERGLVYWEPEWPWDPSYLGLTSSWSTEAGTLVGFEIALNAESIAWTLGTEDGWDLQNAMTHEVGHVLGLGHTPDIPYATMFPSAERGELSKRALHWDDEDGARFLYPEGFAGASPLLLQGCSTAGAAPSLVGTVLPLLVVARRRRSSR